MTLQEKINHSIELIQKTENLALKYSEEGFHLAFSGGKDSQVIYELAKMAGVKFKAYFYKTSVDPKELLLFIRENYTDVVWLRPKMTMFQLIIKKKSLPTRRIRKSESLNRSKRIEFTSDCKKGCDKNLLSPILDWSDSDVWQFLSIRGIQVCSLYKTQTRIGCIGCPMAYHHRGELERFPQIKKAYINTAQKIIDKYPDCAFSKHFESGEDAVNWWTSGLSTKEYCFMRDHQTKLEFTCGGN
jgi:phosphoadenosine phosphosulfate reductase